MSPNLNIQIAYNASEDTFPLPPEIKRLYGPFGFPDGTAPGRPYITSNFVMSLDGKSSFKELKPRGAVNLVSRSAEDRWLMDFIRAHHHAQLMGAGTVRAETIPNHRGLDYAIDDETLRTYREKTLGLGRQKIIILTGSGDLDASLRVFHSPRVETWIITSPAGEKKFQSKLEALGREGTTKIISTGNGSTVDLEAATRHLYQKHGISTLLCEGGSTLYGQLLAAQMIDEDFRTLSLQVMGKSTVPGIDRPTAYGDAGYLPETAPWFKLISLHYSLPYHAFFRLRYVGPRRFHSPADTLSSTS